MLQYLKNKVFYQFSTVRVTRPEAGLLRGLDRTDNSRVRVMIGRVIRSRDHIEKGVIMRGKLRGMSSGQGTEIFL